MPDSPAKPVKAPTPFKQRPMFLGKGVPPPKTSWWLNVARKDWQATVAKEGPQARGLDSDKVKERG